MGTSCATKNCLSVSLSSQAPSLPVDTEQLTPFVKLIFTGNGKSNTIQVGNQSSPDLNNTCVIKSFEYGSSNGTQCEVEILDEIGGAFQNFMTQMISALGKLDPATVVTIEFGWITNGCDGSQTLISSKTNGSGLMYVWLQTIDVSFEGGNIKFKCKCTDLMQQVFQSKTKTSYGTDDSPMALQDALRQLFSGSSPSSPNGNKPDINVEFRKKRSDGQGYDTWDFKNDPRSVWNGDTLNKLATARKWIDDFTTTDGKGITTFWDSSSETPTLVFLEDPVTDPSQQNSSILPIATYIVNGGNCSPVISFNPNINMVTLLGAAAQGGAVGPVGGTTNQTDPNSKVDEQAGSQATTSVSRALIDTQGKNALIEAQKANAKNITADYINTIVNPITAELKIQGDPSYVNPALLSGSYLSLVVINPFSLQIGNCGTSCASWLANPAINSILTSKEWLILGISHSIREGSYVTTFNLQLLNVGLVVPN